MKLTHNQIRILTDISKGLAPRGFSNKSIDSLVKKGLVTLAKGHYKHSINLPIPEYDIYKLTSAGLLALQQAAYKEYISTVRNASLKCDKEHERLSLIDVVDVDLEVKNA